jgi:hypothetical protein
MTQIEIAVNDFYVDRVTVGTSPTSPVTSGDFRDRVFSSVTLKAASDNAGTVYVQCKGNHEVSSADFPIAAGEAITIYVDRLSKIRLLASQSGQIVNWLTA